MAWFRNLSRGLVFEVDDDRTALFEGRPGAYRRLWPCDVCDEKFDSPQALAGHTSVHD